MPILASQGKIGIHGPVVQLGVHAGLSSRRSRVQIPSGPPTKWEAYSLQIVKCRIRHSPTMVG